MFAKAMFLQVSVCPRGGGMCGMHMHMSGHAHPPRHAHPPWHACPPRHTRPPSGYYEMQSMSWRYASYWNAFLFNFTFNCTYTSDLLHQTFPNTNFDDYLWITLYRDLAVKAGTPLETTTKCSTWKLPQLIPQKLGCRRIQVSFLSFFNGVKASSHLMFAFTSESMQRTCNIPIYITQTQMSGVNTSTCCHRLHSRINS